MHFPLDRVSLIQTELKYQTEPNIWFFALKNYMETLIKYCTMENDNRFYFVHCKQGTENYFRISI